MNDLYKKRFISMVLVIIALLGVMLGAYSLYQVTVLSNTLAHVSQKLGFAYLIDQDKQAIDDYLDHRIDHSIERRKRQQLAKTLDVYKLAPEKISGDDSVYGEENARFSLMEFSDLECPYCKRFHEVPKKIVDISEGMVNWQWKHLPLQFHNPAAFKSAHAAECVANIQGNRAFWAYLDAVFNATRGNGQGVKDLAQLAVALGVDHEQFLACSSAGQFIDKINGDIALAKEHNITSTPVTLVIDNKTQKRVQLRGAQPAEAILSTIQRLKKLSDAASSTSMH
ncbi:MAG: DsbA family protein [Cellvibrionaceae bacterium]|nr:DsbA family protein [Cellvibrionaceae bacterium]